MNTDDSLYKEIVAADQLVGAVCEYVQSHWQALEGDERLHRISQILIVLAARGEGLDR